ncbi:lamin-A-like [Mercenaria mercenaria]|uniref:lamin-A-like n=1 Tax=Mercenaria mercenaria TaxID=6596 RepID=UPI00234F906B|nr:lamin-A-like [Mercenaria mercenaria]
MKLHVLFLLCVTFSCAVCRDIMREDSSYWSSIYVESSSEGPFMIAGIDPNGKYIQLENLSGEREYLNGWTITQKTDNNPGVNYTFDFCSIPPYRKRKIVANKWSYNASATDFVATDVYAWETGKEVKTYLYDRNHTLKAEYIVGKASSTNLH